MATEFIIKGRRSNPAQPVHLPEATAAANEVGRVLVGKYGQENGAAILQIMEMVRGSVSKAIQQLLGSSGPSENASAGDLNTRGYAMPARTQEQIKEENPELITAPANIAAPSAQELSRVGPQKMGNDMFAALSRVQDPAQQQLGQPIPNQPMPTNLPPARKTSNGLILPQGEPTQDGDWIL